MITRLSCGCLVDPELEQAIVLSCGRSNAWHIQRNTGDVRVIGS